MTTPQTEITSMIDVVQFGKRKTNVVVHVIKRNNKKSNHIAILLYITYAMTVMGIIFPFE